MSGPEEPGSPVAPRAPGRFEREGRFGPSWRFVLGLLVALGAVASCARSEVQSPAAFTRDFAAALQKARPDLQVTVVGDLELKLATEEGGSSSSFLSNPYALYQRNPQDREEIVQSYVAATLESAARGERPVDRTRIVPIVKDRGWVEEMRAATKGKGGEVAPEIVHEPYNADLLIAYAEDSPKNIRYLKPDDLAPARVERAELRALALENLRRMAQIQVHGENGRYQLTAGESNDGSLLLLDFLWTDLQKKVEGDLVVALPSRDLLFVAGSRDAEGIRKLRQFAEEASAGNPYRLTSKLFVYRGGTFVEWK